MCRRRHRVQMTGSEGQNGNSLAAYRAAPGDDSSGSIRQVDSQRIFVRTKEKESSSRCWIQWCLHSFRVGRPERRYTHGGRKCVGTIPRADTVTDAAAITLGRAVLRGEMNYVPPGNAKAISQANKIVAEHG